MAHIFAAATPHFTIFFHKTFICPPFLEFAVVLTGLFSMATDA